MHKSIHIQPVTEVSDVVMLRHASGDIVLGEKEILEMLDEGFREKLRDGLALIRGVRRPS